MTRRSAVAAMTLVAGIGLPQPAGAQSCDGHLSDFNPQSTTAVVDGHSVGVCAFRSPENTDPFLVWHVGDPGTLDGCIGGISPGSDAPTGQLEVNIQDLICVVIDVETTMPYTAELFDPGGVLVSSVIGSAPSYELPFRYGTWTGYRVVLTPGTLPGGGRDALCVDNLWVLWEGVPVRARTWGTVKTIYR
jgi:hypothetical protein